MIHQQGYPVHPSCAQGCMVPPALGRRSAPGCLYCTACGQMVPVTEDVERQAEGAALASGLSVEVPVAASVRKPRTRRRLPKPVTEPLFPTGR